MIRLNDINKTVIDETKINKYNAQDNETIYPIQMIINGIYDTMYYSTKEARDKDIELLDKLFDVKSIEDKVEVVELKKEVASNNMVATSDDVRDYLKNLNACEPVKEEYLTWEDVKQSETEIKCKLSNGDIKILKFDNKVYCGAIFITSLSKGNVEAYIYDEDLFNALMLKKVE